MSVSPQATEHPEPPSAMTPGELIAKWRAVELEERSASRSHCIDLCRMLGEPTPTARARSGFVRARRDRQ